MKTIRLSLGRSGAWLRQFPDGIPEWDGWRFIFNSEDEEYDYFVVSGDLHAPIIPKCRPENTIFLATEGPSIRIYNKKFMNQFAWVVTKDKTIKRKGVILYQAGLKWWIGWKPGETDYAKIMSFYELKALFDRPKSKLISVISSNKTMIPGHRARLEFALKLKDHYGDKIDFFGRGFVPMDDKLVALKDYRFHVALENSVHDHYFTEKFMDCVLAGAYPLYHGCPNLDAYFPDNSYLRIDINDFDKSVALIDYAIAHEFDKKYRAALLEARNLVLYKHNIFPMLIELIGRIERGEYGKPNVPKLLCSKILPFMPEEFHALFPPPPPPPPPFRERLRKLHSRLRSRLRKLHSRLRSRLNKFRSRLRSRLNKNRSRWSRLADSNIFFGFLRFCFRAFKRFRGIE